MFTAAKVYANIAKIRQFCNKVAIISDIGEVLLELYLLLCYKGVPQSGALEGGCGDVFCEPVQEGRAEKIMPVVTVHEFLPVDAVGHSLDGLKWQLVVAGENGPIPTCLELADNLRREEGYLVGVAQGCPVNLAAELLEHGYIPMDVAVVAYSLPVHFVFVPFEHALSPCDVPGQFLPGLFFQLDGKHPFIEFRFFHNVLCIGSGCKGIGRSCQKQAAETILHFFFRSSQNIPPASATPASDTNPLSGIALLSCYVRNPIPRAPRSIGLIRGCQ